MAMGKKEEVVMKQNLSVLVVDDSDMVRSRIVEKYRELGFGRIDEAEDGLQALDLIDRGQQPYDLINLDIIMPNMHGVECFMKIRERLPQIPVLILTSLAAEPSAAEKLVEYLDEYAVLSSKYDFEKHFEQDVRKLFPEEQSSGVSETALPSAKRFGAGMEEVS